MPFPKQNYFQKRTKPKGPRSNNRITSPEVQVINSDGENLGVLNLQEAISKAKDENLDLIEIAPNARPPVCKIMDMGKYKYYITIDIIAYKGWITMIICLPSNFGCTSTLPIVSISILIFSIRSFPNLVCCISLPLNLIVNFTLSPFERNF